VACENNHETDPLPYNDYTLARKDLSMSLIYGKKYDYEVEGGKRSSFALYGDTKILLEGAIKANWTSERVDMLNKYGIVKSSITCPKCCISYAGNNLRHAYELIRWFENNGPCTEDGLLDAALRIHRGASDLDQIEFIICTADEDDEIDISVVKEGELRRRLESAWIGSYDTFREMQRLALEAAENGYVDPSGRKYFQEAVESNVDDSVGGFVIGVGYRNGEFVYQEGLYSATEREVRVGAGESIPLFNSAELGGYTIVTTSLDGEPLLEFPQIGKAVLYSKRYRIEGLESESEELRYFLLPFVVVTQKNQIVYSDSFQLYREPQG